MSKIMKYSIKKLTQDEFPSQLMEIPQPPKDLWLAGELPSQETVLLTVVGSRKFTSYGKEVCEQIISGLRGYDIAIVSGLAIGMDSIAHEVALAAGLRTIAVPGSGLDARVIYPRGNAQLAQRILENGGALLSEYAPDFRATQWSFPQRNRIMAGLARATLVIEAEQKSGTLITSRLATDYNRDVFAVPGNIFSPNSQGPHMLIKLGATPITCAEDVLQSFGFSIKEDQTNTIDITMLSPDEIRVIELLHEPYHRDHIILMLGLSTSDANILLMKMEIAGLIKETPEGLRRA